MIFEVSPSQIEKLNSEQLVELLKKLLYAEAQRSGISLRGVSVPLQITVPDGGEDARISWSGGRGKTDYLPSRFCIFQSKATDPGPAGWKKEVWTKKSQKSGATRKLNEALEKAIAEQGSYIGFTSAVLIGSKYDRRIQGIKDGIQQAGEDPDRLEAIEIYDANKIASWSEQYPAIAIWLNELQSGLNLKSFQTIKSLDKNPDIAEIPQVEDKARRYFIGNQKYVNSEDKTSNENSLTFEQVKERITDHLTEPKNSIRIRGSSGVGKTRFVYEIFREESNLTKISLATSAIYCDFNKIGNELLPIVQSLANAEKPVLMIVDECSREVAIKLCETATVEGSDLRLITIGNDNQPIEQNNCLNISLSPAEESLIEGIVRHRYPKANDLEITYIKTLSAGYPGIAVLATDNYLEKEPILKSVGDVVDRLLKGRGIIRDEQVRAIECLSLFSRLGVDGNVSDEIDDVAESLARQSGDEMYEHLAYAEKQNLVHRENFAYCKVQPLPIAIFLAERRVDLLRVKTILTFIENASPNLRNSFLSQWRYLSNSKTAYQVTQRILSGDKCFESFKDLNTELGSRCLDAIAYIDPDGVSNFIDRWYGNLSVDELDKEVERKKDFINLLSRLASRKNSFLIAAKLLIRLAALENNRHESPASERFKQLFQLRLCETEVEPEDRFLILDGELSTGDERIVNVCVEALAKTLETRYFTGTPLSFEFGSNPPLRNWNPKLWGEVFNFHRNGLQRIKDIHDTYDNFSDRCEKILVTRIRSLICENLFDDIQSIVKDIGPIQV